MITKEKYENDKMFAANIEAVKSILMSAGYEIEGWDVDIDDVEIVGKSINDLPYPLYARGYDGDDKYDYVDDNGNIILPSSEIPYSWGSGDFFRPDDQEVWYNGNWFVVS